MATRRRWSRDPARREGDRPRDTGHGGRDQRRSSTPKLIKLGTMVGSSWTFSRTIRVSKVVEVEMNKEKHGNPVRRRRSGRAPAIPIGSTSASFEGFRLGNT